MMSSIKYPISDIPSRPSKVRPKDTGRLGLVGQGVEASAHSRANRLCLRASIGDTTQGLQLKKWSHHVPPCTFSQSIPSSQSIVSKNRMKGCCVRCTLINWSLHIKEKHLHGGVQLRSNVPLSNSRSNNLQEFTFLPSWNNFEVQVAGPLQLRSQMPNWQIHRQRSHGRDPGPTTQHVTHMTHMASETFFNAPWPCWRWSHHHLEAMRHLQLNAVTLGNFLTKHLNLLATNGPDPGGQDSPTSSSFIQCRGTAWGYIQIMVIGSSLVRIAKTKIGFPNCFKKFSWLCHAVWSEAHVTTKIENLSRRERSLEELCSQIVHAQLFQTILPLDTSNRHLSHLCKTRHLLKMAEPGFLSGWCCNAFFLYARWISAAVASRLTSSNS